MRVRGFPASAGSLPRWLVPLAVLAVLVTGALVAVLVWSAGPLGPDGGPGSSPGFADESPPDRVTPVSDEVCDVGEPHFRGSEPRNGFLHGGGLGMPMPSGLQFGDPAWMPFAFDVALLRSSDAETWAGVGAVRIDDPYLTPEQASGTVTACLARKYADFHLEVAEARFVEIPGAGEAHERTGSLAQEGIIREFRVLIADTGSPESFAVYVRVAHQGSPAAQALAAAESRLATQ